MTDRAKSRSTQGTGTNKKLTPITFSNYKEELFKKDNYKTYEEILSIINCWSLEEVQIFQNNDEFLEALFENRKLSNNTVHEEFIKKVKQSHYTIIVRDELFEANQLEDLKDIGFTWNQANNMWSYDPKYELSKEQQEEIEFYKTTKIIYNDKVRVTKGYGSALEGMEGQVIDMHPKDEIDEDYNYFTVEFRIQEEKDKKVYLYHLFRQKVPYEHLQLIERWTPNEKPGYTIENLNTPSPFLKAQRESVLRQVYKAEFPNSFIYV